MLESLEGYNLKSPILATPVHGKGVWKGVMGNVVHMPRLAEMM